MMLDLEQRRYGFAGIKEQDIRRLFDMSATRYYQALNALIQEPAALAYDPVLVRRLQRLRSARAAHRAAIASTFEPAPSL